MATETLREQWARVLQLDEQIARIERRLGSHRNNPKRGGLRIPRCGRIERDRRGGRDGRPEAFKSGREFAAWLGLCPVTPAPGGRVQMLGISKRGDTTFAPY